MGADECTFLTNLPENTTCIPMLGFMRAEYTGGSRQSVRQYLLNAIAGVMNSQNIRTGTVQETAYLGERIGYRPIQAPSDDDNNVGLAVGLSAAAALVVLLAGLLFVKRRRTESQPPVQTAKIERVADTRPDIEYLPTTAESFSGSVGSEGAISPPLPADAATVLSDDAIVDDDSVLATRATMSDDATEIAGNGTHIRRTATPPLTENVAAAMVAGLAFLPAAAPRDTKKSQTLRKQRRKKKIKKKTMVRTNSREQIQGMEAITEASEEESHVSTLDEEAQNPEANDSDSDSQYTWVTDESGSRPGSRDPSPARSRTSQGDDALVAPRQGATSSAAPGDLPPRPPQFI